MDAAMQGFVYPSFDSTRLFVQEDGDGPLIILVHGFLSKADVNWIEPGTAAALVDAGFRVVMPDLRSHGESEAPQAASAYPPDALAMDLEALIARLSPSQYDLVGYSLGARTVTRVAIRGKVPMPRRLVLGGMGLAGLIDSSDRRDWFAHTIERRTQPDLPAAERTVVRFLKSTGVDADAAVNVLYTQVDSTGGDLARLQIPTLVVAGVKDHDNGSARDLAAALPNAIYVEAPGTHMSAVLEPLFRQAIVDFLRS
jgi:pimeloyl-ACP methyl ester carboxylesterase